MRIYLKYIFLYIFFLFTNFPIFSAENSSYKLYCVDFFVNHNKTSLDPIILVKDDSLLLPIEGLAELNVNKEFLQDNSVNLKNISYIDLQKLNIEHELILEDLTLKVFFPQRAMNKQTFDVHKKKTAFNISNLNSHKSHFNASYLNYNINIFDLHGKDYKRSIFFNTSNNFLGFIEKGYFSSNFITQYYFSKKPDKNKFVFLNAYFETYPNENNIVYRIGDSSTKAASWSDGAQFFGLQVFKNISSDPRDVIYPVLNHSSFIDNPGKVIVKKGSNIIYEEYLNVGPFDLRNVNIGAGGAGEVIVITEDIRGNRKEEVIPFYSSNNLLKSGVKSYSLSAGLQRKRLGVENFAYADLIASGDYITGVKDVVTVGMHFDSVIRDQKLYATIGGNTIFSLKKFGILSIAFATNTHNILEGAQKLGIGYNFSNSRFALSSQVFVFDRLFRNIYSKGAKAQKNKIHTNLSFNVPLGKGATLGSFQLGYNDFYSTDQHKRMLNVGYQKNILGFGLSIKSAFNLEDKTDHKVNLNLTKKFGIANINVKRDRNMFTKHQDTNFNISTSGSFNDFAGYQWTYQGNINYADDDDHYDYTWRNYAVRIGKHGSNHEWVASVRNNKKITTKSLAIKGSVIKVGKGLMLGNTINNILLISKIGNYDDVGIKVNNKMVTHTKNGIGILTGAPLYSVTTVDVNEVDLPLNTIYSNLDAKIILENKRPAQITFDIKSTNNLLGRLVNENHEALSIGHELNIKQSEYIFFTGEDGSIYLTELADDIDKIEGTACKEGKCCTFDASFTESDKIYGLIKLNDIVCR